MRTGLIKTVNIFTTVVLILIILFVLLMFGGKLFGAEAYTVISGSMEPTYKTGSVIYVKKCDPSDVKPNEPITFYPNESRSVVVTHRAVKIDTENRVFITKGDANSCEDEPVPFDGLIGKPVFCIPYLGYILEWTKTPPGLFLTVAIVAVSILLCIIPEFFKKA